MPQTSTSERITKPTAKHCPLFVGNSNEQRGALALGEAGAAGVAVELAELLVLAESAADREVAGVALPVPGAGRVLAAVEREVVRGHGSSRVEQGRRNGSWTAMLYSARNPMRHFRLG